MKFLDKTGLAYLWEKIRALIPTKLSQLTNDKGYISSYTETDPTVPTHVKGITQANITSWNNKSNFSGSYNDLTNRPTIPSKTSQLANDSNFRAIQASTTDLTAGTSVLTTGEIYVVYE